MNRRVWLLTATLFGAAAAFESPAFAVPVAGASVPAASVSSVALPGKPAFAPAAAPVAGVQPAPAQRVNLPAAPQKAALDEPVASTRALAAHAGDEAQAEAPGVAPSDSEVTAEPAAEQKRGWLRQPREQPVEQTQKEGANWSMSLVALVLLGGLAAAAVVVKLRRSGAPAPWLPATPVRVLSTTRLSPKASLVTADVHGRVVLLGVTEQTVSELGWIDELTDATPPGEEEESSDVPRPALERPAAVSRSGFGQVLGNVFGAAERKPRETEFKGNPSVAALIAARDTRDVVNTSYSRAAAGAERRSAPRSAAAEPAHVETQVAGLVRRRR